MIDTKVEISTGPYIEIVATTKEGDLLMVKKGTETSLPIGKQKNDFSMIQMVYEIMDMQLGYFPMNIEGYCVDNDESTGKGKVTFRCTDCVQIDEKCLNGTDREVVVVSKEVLQL